jgi:hypothetical protein
LQLVARLMVDSLPSVRMPGWLLYGLQGRLWLQRLRAKGVVGTCWNMLEQRMGEPGSRVADVSGFRAVQASFEHLSMFWQVGDGLLQYWTVDAIRHGFRDKVLVHIGIWMHVIYDRFRAKAWYTRKRLQLKVSKQNNK